MSGPDLTRRTALGALAAGGAAALAACTSGSRTASPSATPSSTSSSTSGTPTSSTSASSPSTASPSTASPSTAGPSGTTTTPRPTASLPRTTPYAPDANDVQPAVKLAAARVVEALLAYGAGGAGPTAARARVAATGQDGGLVTQAPGLVGSEAGRVVQVTDAQYGGILAASSSVLVVCRTWELLGGRVVEGGTTVDVRLVAASPRWRVTELHPSAPGAATSALSRAAQQVLASPRITLPSASAADVRSGQVSAPVLTGLLTLAGTFTIGVSVVRSGHPIDVFGTNRRSDHPRGRAVDTQTVDGQAVVAASTPRSLVEAYMRAWAAAGSYNVGGPYLLGGATYFSDATHHDHVHAGFRS